MTSDLWAPKSLSAFALLVLATDLGLGLSAASAQAPAGKKPAQPAIPGLPELPPGVELPAEVRDQLQRALQEAKALENATKAKQPPAKSTPTVPSATRPAQPPRATTPATKPVPAPASAPQATARTIPPSAPAATTFKRVAVEKKLGSIGDFDFTQRDNKKPRFWISPNGKRIAYLIDKGINVDGKAYTYANSIRQRDQHVMHFSFSPDSEHTSWVIHQGQLQGAGQGETLVVDGVPEKIGWNFIANHDGGVFSPDSKHVAYTARRYAKGDVEYVLVVDGQEREVIPKSPAWRLSFTPDSKRVVWAEETDQGYQVRESSVDGKEPRIDRKHGPAQLTMNFFYGPEGQLGYVASDAEKKQFVVYDGKEYEPKFEKLKSLLLSRDGKHLAFVVEPQSFRDIVVIDGKASPTYGGLEADYVEQSLALSPVGGRSAYAIEKRRVHHPVIDGKEGKGYSGVAEFTFSPDGQRLAFWAAQNGKLHMVADGKEGPAYDELGLPVFSPDSKSLAFGGSVRKQKFVTVDGKPHKAYADIGEPEFGPDGKRLVYLADLTEDGPTVLVDNGKEGKQYASIKERLYFSQQGQHLAMVAFAGEDQLVVVDGVEGNAYDLVITLGGGKVQFAGEDKFHYLAVKEGELLLVEETIQQ